MHIYLFTRLRILKHMLFNISPFRIAAILGKQIGTILKKWLEFVIVIGFL